MNRTVSTYGKYFFDFYNKLDKDLHAKIDWVFELVKTVDLILMGFLKLELNLRVIFIPNFAS